MAIRYEQLPFLETDLSEILTSAAESLKFLSQSRISILGGTGFIGSWLTSSINFANKELDLKIGIDVFTRDIEKAGKKFSAMNIDGLELHHLNLSDFPSKFNHRFDFIINAATPSNFRTGSADDSLVTNATINAANFIAGNAIKYKNVPTVLNLSSGAVYGQLTRKRNEHYVIKSEPTSKYSLAKIESEKILLNAENNHLLKATSPRLFAFFGPGLPLDLHFAIGNFLLNGIRGEEINISGSSETLRSYLYPTDLLSTLFRCLQNPISEELNIGSKSIISMGTLAELVSKMTSKKPVKYAEKWEELSIYHPGAGENKLTLPVAPKVELVDGIERWIRYLKQSPIT